MTDDELKAIEARANAATKAPWRVAYANVTSADVEGPLDEDLVSRNYGGRAQYLTADAEFIAHAREDIPALVAEVRRLRSELERALAAKMQEPGSEAGAFNRYALDGSRRKPT